MSRLIDADKITFHEIDEIGGEYEPYLGCSKEHIDNQPTVEAIPKDHIAKAIDKVEEYICNHETDTVKAQGMAQALDIFEQELGGLEEGNQQGFKDAKADYENRLKADMVAMLTEIQLEIKEKAIRKQGIDSGFEYDYEFISSEEVIEVIRQKIDKAERGGAMSMELISREAVLELIEHSNIYSVNLMKNIVSDMPTVQAIPIERLEQILSEIQSLRGCSCSCSDGIIDDVEDIIDKALEEQTGG